MSSEFLEVTPWSSRTMAVCFDVDVLDAGDVAYWATLLDVTVHEIRYAVRHVGADARAVDRFLRFAAAGDLAH